MSESLQIPLPVELIRTELVRAVSSHMGMALHRAVEDMVAKRGSFRPSASARARAPARIPARIWRSSSARNAVSASDDATISLTEAASLPITEVSLFARGVPW